jgi:hypothetical protein
MDRKTAEQMVTTVNQCIDALLETLEFVEKNVSQDEYEIYKRGMARVFNTFDVEIVDRVARDFPDLKPRGDV